MTPAELCELLRKMPVNASELHMGTVLNTAAEYIEYLQNELTLAHITLRASCRPVIIRSK